MGLCNRWRCVCVCVMPRPHQQQCRSNVRLCCQSCEFKDFQRCVGTRLRQSACTQTNPHSLSFPGCLRTPAVGRSLLGVVALNGSRAHAPNGGHRRPLIMHLYRPTPRAAVASIARPPACPPGRKLPGTI